MKKVILISLCVLFTAGTVGAEAEKYGPVPNYKGMQDVSGSVVIPTTLECYIWNPVKGEYHTIKARGGAEYEVHYQTPVFVDSYVEMEESFDPETDDLILTEIFAYDNDPGLDPNLVPEQAGFNQTDPAIEPNTTQGFFRGFLDVDYAATIETVTLMDLPARLPDYDTQKILGAPGDIVYVMQGMVPAFDFVEKGFEFSYEYQGYFEQTDPCWIGPKNPEYPYQHYWELIIEEWSDVDYVSDVHIDEPWTIKPGYIEIVPPTNWHSDGITIGRAGYEANEGGEITAGGGSLGIEWRVNGKIPQVVPGHVTLTMDDIPVGKVMNTMIVASEPNCCGDWGYLDADMDKDCDVDAYDFAIWALSWLDNTDPMNANSSYETIIGVGFAFDGDDTKGPAKIGFLQEDCGCGLDANDIILEYRGHPVSCGFNLLRTIEALPDLTVGESVLMLVLKEGEITPVLETLIAKEIPVKASRGYSTNKRCTFGWIHGTQGTLKKTCYCITGPYICARGWQARRDKTGKIMEVRYHCADTGGNVCHGDWIKVK